MHITAAAEVDRRNITICILYNDVNAEVPAAHILYYVIIALDCKRFEEFNRSDMSKVLFSRCIIFYLSYSASRMIVTSCVPSQCCACGQRFKLLYRSSRLLHSHAHCDILRIPEIRVPRYEVPVYCTIRIPYYTQLKFVSTWDIGALRPK